MTIGDRIKVLREKQNITQEELAKHISSTKQSIYKYENNIITNIPSDKIEKLAKALHTTPAYLMGWKKEDVIVSRKFQMTKEVIAVIEQFPLVINKNTGSSMMDIFNKMISNPTFETIIKRMLMYTARTEVEWENMRAIMTGKNDFPNINKELLQGLCKSEIMGLFEKLTDDIINSEIDTFNKVDKDNDGNLLIGIRDENKYLYNINAAHADGEPTKEDIKKTDDIMDNNDNWD